MGCDGVIAPTSSSSSSSSSSLSGVGVKKIVYIGGVAVPIINLREVELEKQNQQRRRLPGKEFEAEANKRRNAIRCRSREEEEQNSALTTTGIKSKPRGSIASRGFEEQQKRKRFIKKAIENNSMLENVNIPPSGIGSQVRVRSVLNRLENLNIATDSTLSGSTYKDA